MKYNRRIYSFQINQANLQGMNVSQYLLANKALVILYILEVQYKTLNGNLSLIADPQKEA